MATQAPPGFALSSVNGVDRLKRTGDFASAPLPTFALKRTPVKFLAAASYTTGALSVPAKHHAETDVLVVTGAGDVERELVAVAPCRPRLRLSSSASSSTSSLKMPQVPLRPSLAITTGSVAAAPSSKSETMPGLTAQPLRPGGTTTVPPPLPLPPVTVPPPACRRWSRRSLSRPHPRRPCRHRPSTFARLRMRRCALQLAASVSRLTQLVPHSVFVHIDEHDPFEQKGVAPVQTLPQVPQFVLLDLVSTQEPPHTMPTHVAGAPPELWPPAPGEVPLPPVPPVFSGVLDEQLTASKAEAPRVSEAPTNFARNELEFGRNRFHIRTPNLKVRRLAFEGLRRCATSAPCDLHRSVPPVARQSARESAQKSTLSLKLPEYRTPQRQERFQTCDNYALESTAGCFGP